MYIFLQTNSQPISLKPAASKALALPLPIPILIHLSPRTSAIQSVSHFFVVLICQLLTYFKGVDLEFIRLQLKHSGFLFHCFTSKNYITYLPLNQFIVQFIVFFILCFLFTNRHLQKKNDTK